MKRCANCKNKYEPSQYASSFENWCGDECKYALNLKKMSKQRVTSLTKPKQFSSINSKPLKTHKPLQSKTQLKGSALGSKVYNQEKKVRDAKRKIKRVATGNPAISSKEKLDALAFKCKTLCHLLVRLRDKDEVCICCGRRLGPNYHAGHFMESGNNTEIRYDLDNINAQRADCNTQGGDSGEYEERLIVKIGIERVERLKRLASEKNITVRTEDDFIEMIEFFKAEISRLENDEWLKAVN